MRPRTKTNTKIVKSRGKNKELYFTKIDDIRLCIKLLLEKEPDLKNLKWHDPFAGDGRWSDVAKEFGIACFSSDIEPLNNDVHRLNAFDIAPQADTLYIGNPPFSLAKKFVKHFNHKCAFIMQSASFSCGVKHLWYFNKWNKSNHSELKFILDDNSELAVFCFFSYFDEDRSNVVIPSQLHLIPEPKLRVSAFNGVPMSDNYYKIHKK